MSVERFLTPDNDLYQDAIQTRLKTLPSSGLNGTERCCEGPRDIPVDYIAEILK